MRIDVHKYLIIGPESVRSLFFKRMQQLGVAEFIRSTPPSLETPPEVQNFIDALHVLRQMPTVKQEPADDTRSAHVLARHVVELNSDLEKLRERVLSLKKEIERITPFGDFSLAEIAQVEKESRRQIQFFFCKAHVEIEERVLNELIYINSAYGLNYYISINTEKKSYPGLIEMKIDHSLAELKEELAQVERRIDVAETELATLTHKKSQLKQGLYSALNKYHLEDSKARADQLLEGEAFAVSAWLATNKTKALFSLCDELGLYVTRIAFEKKDRVPTYLENKGGARLGEDLINIYDTPSTEDRDPSLWVFIAFGIFFSMIIADAGYGLLLLAISLWLYFKYGRKKGGFFKRFTQLSIALSCGCIVWGVMILSFFGIDFGADSHLRDYSLLNWAIVQKADYFLEDKPPSYLELVKEYPQLQHVTDAKQFLRAVVRGQEGMSKYIIYNNFQGNVLLELVIFIGAVHIMLSFLRYADKNWAGIGWALFILGAYLYFPSILGAVSLIHYLFHVPYVAGALLGKYLVYSGIGLAAVLALIQRRLAGLGEVMHVIQVFADVMSYLRIYALSLAGMIMASTFNDIAMSMPFYIGILIIFFGHTLNFTLAIMGGVIHGLRLNFIEWYHYSFEGGGWKFNPLTLIK